MLYTQGLETGFRNIRTENPHLLPDLKRFWWLWGWGGAGAGGGVCYENGCPWVELG